MINIKRTGGVCTPHKTSTQASILIANPFGRSAIAYINGHTCIIPMRTVSVRYKHPRTQFISLMGGVNA